MPSSLCVVGHAHKGCTAPRHVTMSGPSSTITHKGMGPLAGAIPFSQFVTSAALMLRSIAAQSRPNRAPFSATCVRAAGQHSCSPHHFMFYPDDERQLEQDP